jgi:hypothetical protein
VYTHASVAVDCKTKIVDSLSTQDRKVAAMEHKQGESNDTQTGR